MKYQLTPISSNVKTGPIPTTMTEKDSCPSTCPLKLSGCYAENFPLSLHWNKVAETGMGALDLSSKLSKLPRGQLWRHNVAGDLPHKDGIIDIDEIRPILDSVKSRKLSTIVYTHHLPFKNHAQLDEIKRAGININISCESVEQALSNTRAGFNSVCIMPKNAPKVTKYFDGYSGQLNARVVMCPAQTSERVTCASCGLCAKDRTKEAIIIGFYPHGTKSKQVEKAIA